MNINNQINNINQNYNIGAPNENDISQISIKSNESFKSKDFYNSNKNNQGMNLNHLLNNIEKLTENQSGCNDRPHPHHNSYAVYLSSRPLS